MDGVTLELEAILRREYDEITYDYITEVKPCAKGTIVGVLRANSKMKQLLVEAQDNKSKGAAFEANLVADTETAPASVAPTGDGLKAPEAPTSSTTPIPPQIGLGMLADVSTPAADRHVRL